VVANELTSAVNAIVREIGVLIETIGREIEKLVSNVLSMVGEVIETIRAFGEDLARGFIAGLPEPLQWLAERVLDVYNGMFQALEWLNDGVTGILQVVGGELRSVFGEIRAGVLATEEQVHQRIRQTILQGQVPDSFVRVHITIPIVNVTLVDFTVPLPAGDVLTAVSRFILGHPAYKETVHSVVRMEQRLQSAKAEEFQLRQRQALGDQEAQQERQRLFPGLPINVQIQRPQPDSHHHDTADLFVTIDGVNQSFLDPPPGLPRRVALFINGRQHEYGFTGWSGAGHNMTYHARLIPASHEQEGQLEPPRVLQQVTSPFALQAMAALSLDRQRLVFRTPLLALAGGLPPLAPLGEVHMGPQTPLGVRLAKAFATLPKTEPSPIGEVSFALEAKGTVTVIESLRNTPMKPITTSPSVEVLQPEIAMAPLPVPGVPVSTGEGVSTVPKVPGLSASEVVIRPEEIQASIGQNVVQVVVADGTGLKAIATSVFYLTVSRPARPDAIPGLVAWWRLDGNAEDVTGRNHGRIGPGTGAQFGPGKIGECLEKGIVRISNTPDLTLSEQFTLAFWFRPQSTIDSSIKRTHTFFLKGNNTVNTANSNGCIEVRGPNPRPISTTNQWVVGTWHHVAVSMDHTGYKLYIDGILEGSSASTSSILSENIDIQLGEFDSLDEVLIYNRALELDEVTGLLRSR
jgi:hypothetical protein